MEGRQLLLLALLPMVIGLPMEHASESVNFMNGFPVNFAEGLPTDEFNSALSGLSRSKRQVGVSEHIRDMLSEPYNGPKPSDISSLFERNSLDRPVRESPSSDSTRFPQPFQPSSTFLENLFQQPARQQVRKPVPQPPRQSFQQPVRRPVKAQPTRQTVQQVERKPQPTRQTVQQVERRPQPTRQTVQQVERRPQPTRQTVQQVERRPQQNFSPESRFPSFSEAQAEHKRTNDENTNHFTNADFFESARIREKRDITTNQGITSQIDNILSSPFEGSIPPYIESLYSRNNNNRVARKISDKQQLSSSKATSSIDTSNNHQSFTFPFRIPNFFKNIGIRRSSLGAEDRQDVSGGLDDILSAPYTGNRPTSIEGIEGLFYRDRNLKKRNPQPFITPTSQQNSQSPNQERFNLNPNVGHIIIHSDSQPQSGFISQPKRQTVSNSQVQLQPQIQNNPHNKLIPLSQSQSVTSSQNPNTFVHSFGEPNSHKPIRPSTPQFQSGFRPSRSPAQLQQSLSNNNQQFVSNQFSSSSYQLIYPSSHVNVQHGRKKRDTSLKDGEIMIDLNHSGSDFYPAIHPIHLNTNRNKGKPIYQFQREFVENLSPHHPGFFEQESNFLQNIDEIKQSTRNVPVSIGNPPFVRQSGRKPPRFGPSQHPRFGPSQRTPRFGPRRSQIRRPKNLHSIPPAFKPGPSPPANILPSTSIRSARHIFRDNKRTPRVNRQEDIPVNRRSTQHIGNLLSDGKT